MKLAQQEQFKKAIAKFLGSLRLLPNTKKSNYVRAVIHKYIGRAYHRQKKYQKARDYYLVYLRLLPKGKNVPQVKTWTREILPFLRAKLRLRVIPKASCLVLYPGGRWKGMAPASVPVFAGKVSVHCDAKGFKPSKKAVVIKADTSPSLSLVLIAKVLKRIPPPKAVSAKKKPAWVGLMVGGLGLAGIGAAGLVGGLALSEREQATLARDQNTTASSTQALQLNSSANQKALTANILYITGGTIAVTGLVLFLALRSSKTKANSTASLLPPKGRKRLLKIER